MLLALRLPEFRGIGNFAACACGAGIASKPLAGNGPLPVIPARVFPADIFDLDGTAEGFGKEAESGVDLFGEPRNFMRALLSVLGKARAPRGPACISLRRALLKSVGDDEARRRSFLIILLVCGRFIGPEMFYTLQKEIYAMVDDLVTDMDSISGGEFSRYVQGLNRAALERAETAEAEVKGLKDDNSRLRRALKDSGAGKGPGGS
jgi:hypothetical protein